MGLFGFAKKNLAIQEPPIPESEKKYYQPDSYYTNMVPVMAVGANGKYAKRKVVTFEERKKVSYPSKNGLYVAEILLLEYCSYGTYPHPRNGYPGFWWFEYGIRNIGYRLDALEQRGFIEIDSAKRKYKLTALGKKELKENQYVPYMHKTKDKTIDVALFGPIFNVWEVNRRIKGGDASNWKQIVKTIEKKEKIIERKGMEK